MAEDLRKIKDWLKKQEVEQPIPTKSSDRVLTSMAKSIQHNKPLRSGGCSLCGTFMERLMPIPMKVCLNCAKKFVQKSGSLPLVRKSYEKFSCDYCFATSFVALQINPRICEKCVKRIGKFHRLGGTE